MGGHSAVLFELVDAARHTWRTNPKEETRDHLHEGTLDIDGSPAVAARWLPVRWTRVTGIASGGVLRKALVTKVDHDA